MSTAGIAALRAASQVLGRMPVGLGQYAVATRIAQRCHRLPAGTVATQKVKEGAVLHLDLADRLQAEAFLLRRFHAPTVAYLASRMPPNGVMWDVGANVGMVTLSVAARWPAGRYVAFEPSPKNFAQLERNIAANPHLHVDAVRTAVGAEPGELRIIGTDPHAKDGNYYVADPSEDAAGRDDFVVPVLTLEGYAEQTGTTRIDVLKIDVEGFENQVLAGARDLIENRRVACVVTEINESLLEIRGQTATSISSFFADAGYRREALPALGAQRLRRSTWDADVAFVCD